MMPAWRWVAGAAGPVLQGTAAATVAWLTAKHVALHPEPFFAPIAAVIGLNAPLGERGLNTLRLLLGVFVGIVVAELTMLVLGTGPGRLALATFVAMVLARALGGARIVIGQAASSAILTVATANGRYGLDRVGDAMIGATVALGFSQVLFSPEPLRLVRRAEGQALAAIAEGLVRTARALEGDDPALVERAVDWMRGLHDRLADLGRLRRQSSSVARHSAMWWTHRVPLVAERERAGNLDLLGTSCLMLTRTALVAPPPDRARLAAMLRELGRVIGELAQDPGARATRQAAIERGVLVSRRFEDGSAPPPDSITAAAVSLRMVVADLLLFAGVAHESVVERSREGGSS